MSKQPAGTTREEAQELLCRSLAEILPTAEELGVTVGIEPVTLHSMNSPGRHAAHSGHDAQPEPESHL